MPNLPTMSNPSFGMPNMGSGDYSGSKSPTMPVGQWPSMPSGGFQQPFSGPLPSAPNPSFGMAGVGQGMSYYGQPSPFQQGTGASVMGTGPSFPVPNVREIQRNPYMGPNPTWRTPDGGGMPQPIRSPQPLPPGQFIPVGMGGGRTSFGGR